MKAKLLIITGIITLTGCIHQPQPKPIDWRDYVTPLENGEFVTIITSNTMSDASGFARKMMWATCDNYEKTPTVIDTKSERTGLMSEKAADVHDIVRSVAYNTGNWIPSVNDESYKFGLQFSCTD